MNTIDRYVIRAFLGGFLTLLLTGTGLFIFVDVLLNFDEFSKDPNVSATGALFDAVDYYVFNLPLFFSYVAGPSMAVAAAFCFALMLRNNELTALVAAGVPLQRLIVPLLACAVPLVALWWVNREWVIPEIAHKIARDREDVRGTRAFGVYCVKDSRDNILIALQFYPRDGSMRQAYVIEPGPDGRAASLIQADEARFDPAANIWRFDGRAVRTFLDPGGGGLGRGFSTQNLTEFKLRLTPDDLILRQAAEWADLLSLRHMNRLVNSEQQLANRPTIIMSRHVRLTQPVLICALMLLAVPFFLTREPVNVIVRGTAALLLCLLFFVTTFVCHSLVREDIAALLAWMPILIFAPVGVLLVANLKT
ncbi:MAG: LptF/LptG family permease [Phycisphaerales bacterium]|nr:LptF/LptG family permease [Phycisphaerales bacterium]